MDARPLPSPTASPAAAPVRCRWRLDGWRLATVLVAALVAAPLGVVLLSFTSPAGEVWTHLRQTLLGKLVANTLWLALGVGTTTAVLGVSLAWLTAACEFPGRRFFSWALLLPLAMPTYVLAFVFLGLMDYSGPVQTQLRLWFGSSGWFPPVRSTGGVVAVLSLALYPYVYLLARNAFATQSRRAMEAAQALGVGRRQAFFTVVLPMARPWIAGGCLLVLMETLADFGAVSIFNYDTFTTAVYKAWFGFFNLAAAAQLASVLVVIAFLLIALEHRSRARMRFTTGPRSNTPTERIRLTGWARWGAAGFSLAVFAVAFAVPVAQLVVWAAEAFREEVTARYLYLVVRSMTLGLTAAVLLGAVGLVLAYASRRHADPLTRGLVRFSTLGYALPGTVLAVGVFIPVAALDNAVTTGVAGLLGIEFGGFLRGTLVVMLAAYLVRFLAASFNALDSAMHRISPSLDEAARLFGLRGWRLPLRIHLPLLKGGLMTAATLVFVDVMKEMPITLMTRPFGWDTLAVKIFELTSEGEWQRAALPAVALVFAGLLPVILMTRHTDK